MDRKRRSQYFQKENYIELKTLEYYLWWNTKLAKDLFLLRHELNSLWFEKYIKFRLKKLWYIMKNNTWWNKADWWIDLKGSYKDIPVYIQCKKYIKNSTYKWISRISDIRNFHSWVIDDFGVKNYATKEVFLVFITTGSFTQDARSFAKRNNIRLIDYKEVANMTQNYSLNDFYKEIGNTTNIINKKFNQQTNLINFSFDDLLQEDLFQYFKNIRSYIVSDIMKLPENVTWFETFDDNTLKDFAQQRIHNFIGLKKYYKTCTNDLIKEHIDNFSSELVNGFKILDK